MEHRDTPLDQGFCQDCHAHLQSANDMAESCTGFSSTPTCYDRIYYEFLGLREAARSTRQAILEKYAKTMAGYTRFLRDKRQQEVTTVERKLLVEGIQFALQCRAGQTKESCPEMNYDTLLPLLNKIEAQMQLQ